MPNPVPAAAEGMPEINRRRLLGNLVAMSAASAAVGASAAVAATYEAPPAKSPREQALWHMRELQRLAKEDGAGSAFVVLVGRPWGGVSTYRTCKSLMLDATGMVDDCGAADFLTKEGGAV